MSKLPAFQFYPGDWMKDPALRSVSVAARGLWMDLLCLMFECPERGTLARYDGSPFTNAEISRATGVGLKMVNNLVGELQRAGVLERNSRGAISSRRQRRFQLERESEAERKREAREIQRLGQKRPGMSAECPPDVRRSSSSSSSSNSFFSKEVRTTSASRPEAGGCQAAGRFDRGSNQKLTKITILPESLGIHQDAIEAWDAITTRAQPRNREVAVRTWELWGGAKRWGELNRPSTAPAFVSEARDQFVALYVEEAQTDTALVSVAEGLRIGGEQ